jgi:hypothetical protein
MAEARSRLAVAVKLEAGPPRMMQDETAKRSPDIMRRRKLSRNHGHEIAEGNKAGPRQRLTSKTII